MKYKLEERTREDGRPVNPTLTRKKRLCLRKETGPKNFTVVLFYRKTVHAPKSVEKGGFKVVLKSMVLESQILKAKSYTYAVNVF